jgi:hypothetical protein
LAILAAVSHKTAGGLAVFQIAKAHRRPRVSAENEMSIADNLWQNSKNSENRRAAAHFVHLMNASEH